MFFFTGKERSASEILEEQDQKTKQNDHNMENNLHAIKDIGLATRKFLEKGQVDELGNLFHTHWTLKKKRSDKMSDPFLDECYETARTNGALGGKLMGAGGGGFFIFYCENGKKEKVSEALKKMGLRRERFNIDWEGARILLNSNETQAHKTSVIGSR
jgi:D-glycero-alpha-D-manno-heptose-7-phosphate kinase